MSKAKGRIKVWMERIKVKKLERQQPRSNEDPSKKRIVKKQATNELKRLNSIQGILQQMNL